MTVKLLETAAAASGLLAYLPKDESGALTREAQTALSKFYTETHAQRFAKKNMAIREVLLALPATRTELMQALPLPRSTIDFALQHLVEREAVHPGVRTDRGVVYHPRQPHTDAPPLWSVCGVTPAAVLKRMGDTASVVTMRKMWGIGPASARAILKRMVAEDLLVVKGFGPSHEKLYAKKVGEK